MNFHHDSVLSRTIPGARRIRSDGKEGATAQHQMLPGFVQAHHIDTDFCDTHYNEGLIFRHAEHAERWHGGSSEGEERT